MYDLHLQKKNWGTEKVMNSSVSLDQGTGEGAKSIHLSCASAKSLTGPSLWRLALGAGHAREGQCCVPQDPVKALRGV